MTRTSLALVASLIFTPAMADECNDVKIPHTYEGMTVHEEADVDNHKFCVSFTPDSPQIMSVDPSPDKPGCIDVEGEKAQIITPVIISKIGIAYIMDSLGFDQAKDEFETLVSMCHGIPPGPKTPVNFPVIPGATFKRLDF